MHRQTVTDEEFLLCCIEHAKTVNIDFKAVAEALGYSSDKVVGNRLRNIRKRLQDKASNEPKEKPKTESEIEKNDSKGIAKSKPKAKRARKGKSSSKDEDTLTIKNET